ncbi:MAG: helicase-related protein [Acidilobaceae archaeon]
MTDKDIEVFTHQLEALALAAARSPLRFFLADEIGLGKTITAISLMKLLTRDRRRALILVPKILMRQWCRELLRMGIKDSKYLKRTGKGLSACSCEEDSICINLHNVSDVLVASMDLAKKKDVHKELGKLLREKNWNLIVVDEAHRLSSHPRATERFSMIGEKLVKESPQANVIFLSATPHRGYQDDYVNRLWLLDPALDAERLRKETDDQVLKVFYSGVHRALLLRRTRRDVNQYEGKKIFTNAHFQSIPVKTQELEEQFMEKLREALKNLVKFANKFEKENKPHARAMQLLAVTLFKRASSSPKAAFLTLTRMKDKRESAERAAKKENLDEEIKNFVRKVEGEVFPYEDIEWDEGEEELEESSIYDQIAEKGMTSIYAMNEREGGRIIENIIQLKGILEELEKGDSKLRELIKLIEKERNSGASKIIIFTEFKDTLDYLRERLPWGDNVLTLSSEEARSSGKLRDITQKFANDDKYWLLISTDVASEGVNLQVANVLINYEVPWSMVKLVQRVGRIWRLGQKRDVKIYFMFLDTKSDRAAWEKVYEKVLEAKRAGIRTELSEEALLRFQSLTSRLTSHDDMSSEFKLILTYLEGGEEELERSVDKSLGDLDRDIEFAKRAIMRESMDPGEVQELMYRAFGFPTSEELKNSMEKLTKLIGGYEEGNPVKVLYSKFGTSPRDSSTRKDFLHVRSSADIGKVWLTEMIVKTRDGKILYRQPLAITEGKILKGRDLIEMVAKAMGGKHEIRREHEISEERERLAREREAVKSQLEGEVRELLKREVEELLEPLRRYGENMTNVRGSSLTMSEEPDVEIAEPFAVIEHGEIEEEEAIDVFEELKKMITREPMSPEVLGERLMELRERGAKAESIFRAFETMVERMGDLGRALKESFGSKKEIDESLKREIERKAIEAVMKYEREHGREPRDVSLEPCSEERCYDVESWQGGELVRKIEVKGHMGDELVAELTENEMREAERSGKKYWIYIVTGACLAENCRELEIHEFPDPLNMMEVKELTRLVKRYELRPKSSPDQ